MKILGSIVGALLAFLAITRPIASWGYPQTIAQNYTSCVNCHYHPAGGDALTDYGRVYGVTGYSAKPFWAPNTDEEKLASWSEIVPGFNAWTPHIRPQINYRGLWYLQNLTDSRPTQPRWINMRADASLVIRSDDENKFFFEGNIGYLPDATPRLVTRNHFVGAQVSERYRLYAGLMDIAYGMRIPDHIAFSRIYTGLAQNDQSHSLLVHSLDENLEWMVQAMAGNLLQSSDLRFKGFTAKVEYGANSRIRNGFSVMNQFNNFRSRWLGAFHNRFQFVEGSALLSEVGWVRNAPKNGTTSTNGIYFLMQPTFKIIRGLYGIWTLEFYSADFLSAANRTLRNTVGLQWFAVPKVEFRIEAASTRTFGISAVDRDPLNGMIQMGVWL